MSPGRRRGLRRLLPGRVRGVLAGAVVAGSALSPFGCSPPAARDGSGSTGAARPAPLFGVTVDDIGDVRSVVAALRALPDRPTVRVVFDARQPASYYLPAVRLIAGSASVMGELLDSSEEQSMSATALADRARQYTSVLGSYVSLWEVGNELNGSWLGSYDGVAARLAAAFDAVKSAGGRTAVTLYANNFGPDHCGDGDAELTPEDFTSKYVPQAMRVQVDLVLLSYYPDQCGGQEPASSRWAKELASLHGYYPRSRLGIGEVGLTEPVDARTAGRARQVMAWAYSLDPGPSYFAGGYFWWYGAEDSLGPGKPLAGALAAAFRSEAKALG